MINAGVSLCGVWRTCARRSYFFGDKNNLEDTTLQKENKILGN